MMDSGPSAREYRLRMLGRLQGRAIASVCLGLLAAAAAYFALHSFTLAMTETSALPIGDVYSFYAGDYFSYLDGHYSLWRLFAPHNEHPILTTRLVLFVDTIWFAASGKFGTVVSYVLVFVTATMMAYLAAPSNKWERVALVLVFLGLGCSTVQLDNLSIPFQIPFFFVHAFALATLIALWHGLEGRRWWYVVAFACDFGAVFSLGSGIFLVGSCVAMAVWARRIDKWFVIFFAFHLLLILLYVWLGGGRGSSPFPPSIARGVAFFLVFLGNFVVEWPIWALRVGAAVAAICAALFSWLTWRALFRGMRFGIESVSAAFAAFIVLEAIATGMSRAYLGVDYALSLKYTTPTLLLVAALFAFVWRVVPQPLGRVAALLALSSVLVAVNSEVFENGWRARNRVMDAIVDDINHGKISAEAPVYLGVNPDVFGTVISRFRELHLGPFRGTN
jgi:hypothetical protein